MKVNHRTSFVIALTVSALVAAPPWLSAQAPVPVTAPSLTPEQMETFLLKAKILSSKDTKKGITNAQQATLSDGRITHDVHIQTVNISQTMFQPAKGPAQVGFKDTYRYNIAAYRLSLLLGLDNVPMSVQRTFRGLDGAFTWWVDEVLMDDGVRLKGTPSHWKSTRTAGQIHVMRVFDALIANTDRNVGNILWTIDGKMWMIDHTRAFRLLTTLSAPQLLQRCERDLLKAMQELSFEQLKKAMGTSLNSSEIEAVLERRDVIVKLFEEKIAQRGESAVLYTLER
jgi:hypothetical protein